MLKCFIATYVISITCWQLSDCDRKKGAAGPVELEDQKGPG